MKRPKSFDIVCLEADDYILTGNVNNLVFGEGRQLILPACKQLTSIQIVFFDSGEFSIVSEDNLPIRIGNTESTCMTCRPGEPGFDTQPRFIFVPSKNCWVIVSQGNFEFEESEEQKETLPDVNDE